MKILTHLNNLLVTFHLRRSKIWEPRTLLDWFLSSPLQYLASLVYRHILLPARGTPFYPARGKRPIRVVCISDTHNQTLSAENIPEGDVLIHCGDLTVDGTVAEIERQVGWLRGQSHRYKIVVGGNHDSWLDESDEVRGRMKEKGIETGEREVDWSGVEYLCDRALELEFEGGRKLNVYGWGAVPWCGKGFALQYPREKHPWKGRIPDETDILITHTPPHHHLDLGIGCAGLLEEVWRVKPKLHVFGHVHFGHGKEAVYYDHCQQAYESLMSRPGKGPLYDLIPSARWVDALNMVWYGLGSILWKWLMLGPGTNNGALMANAALMYGDSGKLLNPVTVVDL
ncbi:Metallo-dependent phosphatase [Parathielavia appendiculata]|uniref:Metallo-dependent phosphatase n=1 Tax=Parathielavia appendiculata TaxID=2587402 RepID=A0AAN6Z6Q2_9PEZI|nr:Metallo-dependent phosphatase [Parathielavia appendiculata]